MIKRIFNLPFLITFLYFSVILSPLISGKIPVPTDTIVGLYHPWRDFYSLKFPSGIAFKNYLVTDPVRQQLVWRALVVDSFKKVTFPGWNPYSFSGTPLAGNAQAAAFYPLNIIYFVSPFLTGWVFQVFLQTILSALFMFLYLRNKKLRSESIALGVLAWVGSGFMIAWWSLNSLASCALYIPLILLTIDKITLLSSKRKTVWAIILGIALASCFLAGSLQIFLYVALFSFLYALLSFDRRNRDYWIFGLLGLILFAILTFPSWWSIWRFLGESSRTLNLTDWHNDGWFLPWQNLIQFVVPDYFGNPATLNYFGVWNYMEFIGYIGVLPIFFCFYSLNHKIRQSWFFLSSVVICLMFMLPTTLAKIPYEIQIPIFSLAQPTRLMVLVDFSLSVVAAYGFDHWINNSSKLKSQVVGFIGVTVFLVVGFLVAYNLKLNVSLKNLVIPTFLVTGVVLIILTARKSLKTATFLILALTLFDLTRFALKFEPYASPNWLFPVTKTLSFLEEDSYKELFRVATTEDRIFPGNFSNFYHLQFVGGYDSLMLSRYGELISTIQSGSVRTRGYLDFNRIVIPNNFKSKLFQLLNVKYILALNDLNLPNYKLTLTEGQTRVYENMSLLPRVFYAKEVIPKERNQVLETLLSENFDPRNMAVVEDTTKKIQSKRFTGEGTISVLEYSPNRIVLKTQSLTEEYLVFLDSYYQSWQVTIDGVTSQIYPTDFAFRGVLIPAGRHTLVFKYSLI